MGPTPPDDLSMVVQCAAEQFTLQGPSRSAGLLAWNHVRNEELSSFHIDAMRSDCSVEMSSISRGSFLMLNWKCGE